MVTASGRPPTPEPEEDLSDYWAPYPPIGCLTFTQAAANPTASHTEEGPTMTEQQLPHDAYMSAVVDAFAIYNIDVVRADTTTQDGELLEAFIEFDSGNIDTNAWLHGVYLGWDHHRGWHLIEAGGGRNIHELDPEGVITYSSPRQVACSTANALAGQLSTGPIANDGSWVWDSRPLEAAIEAWEAGQ